MLSTSFSEIRLVTKTQINITYSKQISYENNQLGKINRYLWILTSSRLEAF